MSKGPPPPWVRPSQKTCGAILKDLMEQSELQKTTSKNIIHSSHN